MGQIFRNVEGVLAANADPLGMAEQVMLYAPVSDAEALKLLRDSFPDRPLSARVAALAYLMRRQPPRPAYKPR